jgi:hypothetical protein
MVRVCGVYVWHCPARKFFRRAARKLRAQLSKPAPVVDEFDPDHYVVDHTNVEMPAWFHEIPGAPATVIIKQGTQKMQVSLPYTVHPFSLDCVNGKTPAQIEVRKARALRDAERSRAACAEECSRLN